MAKALVVVTTPGRLRCTAVAVLLFAALVPLALAGVVRDGAEFRVNTFTLGSEGEPSIAVLPDGGFLVVWDGSDPRDGIFAQRFDSNGAKTGSAFQLNTAAVPPDYSSPSTPSIALAADGSFVVVWEKRVGDDDPDIFRQSFDSTGAKVGGEFQVNTYTYSYQTYPGVTVAADRSFLVVWTNEPGYSSIQAQHFDSSAVPDGPEFQVNTYSLGFPLYAKAAGSFGAGYTVVVWQSLGQDGDDDGIFAQRIVDSSGAKVGDEFQVNSYTPGFQQWPDVAVWDDGSFVVVWDSFGQDGSGKGIFGQRFDSSGAKVGSEFQVNTYTTRWQEQPSVATDPSGAFVVVWKSDGQDGDSFGIFGQRFDSSGLPDGPEFQVNTFTAGSQGGPSDGFRVATGPDGNFVVVWESEGQDGNSFGVFGQRFRVEAEGALQCGDASSELSSTGGASTTEAVVLGVTDALAVLRAAVGLSSCNVCVCDVNGSGKVTVTDALAVLQHATGLPVELRCPPCV